MESYDTFSVEGKTPEELERQIYDLKNLIGLGISLSSTLDFENLVESILYSCIGQMFVEKVSILLQVDIDINDFSLHMTKGFDDQELPDSSEILLTESSPLIKYFDKNTNPENNSTLYETPELQDDLNKLMKIEPEILIPIKSKDSLNGILILSSKITGEPFNDSEKEFLRDLGKFAAIAVENSRLYLMATLDRMTRLYIHHYFQERLKKELKRSERTGSPVTVIMTDIDHFKNFNDTYGHQQGDIVLKETAQIIKDAVRTTDLPARYGGEEFVVILPDTDLDAAIPIAKRIRELVEQREYPGQKDVLHVTISLGVAQYNPKIDNNKNDLIERADSAMYKAKQTGRNKVVAHKG